MSSWGTYPTSDPLFEPEMRTSPVAGGRMPTRVSSSVVFPVPLPPTIATTSPGATENETAWGVPAWSA
jgi:hypothetical protein